MKMEAVCLFRTSVISLWTTQHREPEDSPLHSHCCENLKLHILHLYYSVECRYLDTDQCGRLLSVAPLISISFTVNKCFLVIVKSCPSWTSCDSASDSAYLPTTKLPYNHNPQPGAIAPPPPFPSPRATHTMTPSQQLVAPAWTKVSYKRGRSSPDDSERESKQIQDSQHWLHPPTTATSSRFLPLMETNNPESEHNPGSVHTPKPSPIYIQDVTSSCWNKLQHTNTKQKPSPTTRPKFNPRLLIPTGLSPKSL
jgi:hypothetical protein